MNILFLRRLALPALLGLLPLMARAQTTHPATQSTGSSKGHPAALTAPDKKEGMGQLPIFPSPQGVYAVMSTVGVSNDHPSENGIVSFRLLRAAYGTTKFREVAEVRMASSITAFRKQAGPAALAEIAKAQNLASEDVAWAYVQAHPQLDNYGALALDMGFRVAMGTAALDAEATPALVPAGTRFIYRLEPEFAKGKGPSKQALEAGTPLEKTITIGQRSNLFAPQPMHVVGADSLVRVRWKAPVAQMENALSTLFGKVWARTGNEREFKVASLLLATQNAAGDSLNFYYEQAAVPETAYRFYLEPLDFVGNPGPASDTAFVLAVSVERTPLVTQVTARDTTTGITLRWPALPLKGYLLGIEVQRSRTTTSNYVRLDTIPATATSFLDTRLLPNITYHYRLRALLRGGLVAPDVGGAGAFAAHEGGPGRSPAPLAPVRLAAVPEKGGVRLRWQAAGPNPDHRAWIVYRGRSDRDTLRVVSRMLEGDATTFKDSTAHDGRRQYAYAVREVDINMTESPLSALAFAQPDVPVAVTAALGLSGYADGRQVHLQWEDVPLRDTDVQSYHLYRRPQRAGTPTGAPAPYVRLAANVPGAAYDDATAEPGTVYEYAVACVDAQQHESPLSPAFALGLKTPPLLPPSRLYGRAVPTGVELSWSEALQAPKGYVVYRRTLDQPQLQRLTTVASTKTSYLDLTAKPNTRYLYALAVLGAGRESARTAEISAQR
jgi:fibronectin type 3 domain-containing protein